MRNTSFALAFTLALAASVSASSFAGCYDTSVLLSGSEAGGSANTTTSEDCSVSHLLSMDLHRSS
jgi:hypothetical protein